MPIYKFSDMVVDPQKYPWGYKPLWDFSYIDTALWLDGKDSDTVTLIDNRVSQWADKSGNAHHAPQPTSADRPGYDPIGGKLIFPSGDNLFLPDNIASFGSVAAFWVGKYTSFPYTTCYGFSGHGDNERFHVARAGAANFGWVLGDNIELASVSRNTDPHIFGLSHSGTDVSCLLDGIELYSGTKNISGVIPSWAVGGVINMPRLAGEVWEVVIITEGITQGLLQKVNGYLAHKWGLAANLPAAHPYKDAAP